MRDKIARSMTTFFRFFADVFFGERYGHRALVLETVAGVPGMVGGMLTHLYSLRSLKRGQGTMIHELLAEAENERKHLMFFMEIVQPSRLERFIIIIAQFIFWHYYLFLYMFFPKTAHLMVSYFEEEAVRSYTKYLQLIQDGKIEDVPAPQIAIDYYGLMQSARLSHMITQVRNDEMNHMKANQQYSKAL